MTISTNTNGVNEIWCGGVQLNSTIKVFIATLVYVHV